MWFGDKEMSVSLPLLTLLSPLSSTHLFAVLRTRGRSPTVLFEHEEELKMGFKEDLRKEFTRRSEEKEDSDSAYSSLSLSLSP